MSLAPYRRVLALPGVKSLLLGGFMARMAYAAMGLSLILYVRFGLELGYFEAGLAGAAFVVGGALGSTLWGRVVDRSGLRPVLVITSVGMGAFWLSLVFLPFPVLLGAALVGGLLNLPVFVVVRQPLAALVPEESRRTAFSLDSTLVEITFMIGPAVATTMAATAAPAVTPIAIGIWAPLSGALLWWINPRTRADHEEAREARPPLRKWLTGPVAAMLIAGVGTTVTLAGSDVAIVSLLEHNSQLDQAWIVMSLWAAYSMTGGLVFGTMHRDVNPLVLLGVMGVATIPLGLLGHWWLVAALLVPAGVVTAPTIAASVDKVSKLVPASVRGEAMGMHGSAMTIGIAVGGPLVGWSVDYLGPQWGFVTAGSGAVVAAIAAAVLIRLGRVRPPQPEPAPATACLTAPGATVRWSPGRFTPVRSSEKPQPGSLHAVYRTYNAGEIRATDIEYPVCLAGWVARRRDHGGVEFIDLRDASGVVQVVFRDGEAAELAKELRDEFCVQVNGVVARRPEGNENPDLPTGEIEIVADKLTILSRAAALPLPIDDHLEVGEDVRLKHRYLDLRRSGPATALRLRSQANRIARNLLHDEGFVEIETPTLTRSTPEGARDFLVPVRLQPGTWYALPQSPQLFKQLLMVSGFERYYQIARCYRDEDFRADRQPEFTQLDIEASFVTEDDVIKLGEKIVAALWKELAGYELPGPIPLITWHDAMRRYGSDKPDLRFGVELVDLSTYLKGTEFRVFSGALAAGGHVGAVVMPGGASQTRKELDGWQDWAKARGARGLAYVLFDAETGEPRGPVAKNLSEEHLSGLATAVGAKPGDAVFFAASTDTIDAQELLGAARLEIGRRCGLIDADEWAFCWVVDAPMFGKTDEGWTSLHHPFTSPNSDWARSFQDNPGEALAYAYDIVCNGNEIGGGSIRIHDGDTQRKVFDVLGIDEAEAADKFGFLLEAFKYGPPPHGGIAFGWDRICALLSKADSIREVIAFPKSRGGHDPLTGAPTTITAQQRKEAGVDAKPVVKEAN